MSVWPYWRLFWENVNYDYLTVLTNESDNTKRIKEEKKIEKTPTFLKNILLSIKTTLIGLFQALAKLIYCQTAKIK